MNVFIRENIPLFIVIIQCKEPERVLAHVTARAVTQVGGESALPLQASHAYR